jgi:hypothetical protein
MKFHLLLLGCAFAGMSAGNGYPKKAPASGRIAQIFGIPSESVTYGRSNIDPILARSAGVIWDYDYRLSTEPPCHVRLAILSPKYIPKAVDGVESEENKIQLQKKFSETNGDVIYVHSFRATPDRMSYVARLVNHEGDWDLFIQIIPFTAAPAKDPFWLDFKRLRSIALAAEILIRESADPAPGQPTPQPADKGPAKDQPSSTPTPKDAPR